MMRSNWLEASDIPSAIGELFMDFETTSGNSLLSATNPWKHCSLRLAVFTWDDHPNIYYTTDPLIVKRLLEASLRWVNHNVKYDAHVAYNDQGIDFAGEYSDTLTLAKLVDSDRTYKGGYGLDALSKHYLDRNLDHYYLSLKPHLGKSKDYGVIPIDVLAEYACAQVEANRDLYHKLLTELAEETQSVWKTEQALTKTLVTMERTGLRINPHQVKLMHLQSLNIALCAEQQLEGLLGYPINPNSNKQCQDLLINRFGLPPVYKEGNVNPTFDKYALRDYLKIQDSPTEILQLLIEYRQQVTLIGLFWEPWTALHVDGRLHPDNNQCVRSGRMSCKNPNDQQLSDEAREQVIPDDGCVLVVNDYKQIEYRFIIHYINDEKSIKSYSDNPDIDFHQMIADDCGVSRDDAKTLNLAMGFGMGVKKTLSNLQKSKELLKKFGDDQIGLREEAQRIYAGYHRKLPGLKQHTLAAELAARTKGFVKNAYGRRSHLPIDFARKAFNRVVQSHAADLIKERAVALSLIAPKHGAKLLALVHDEVLSQVPKENLEAYLLEATEVLNQSSVPVRVPIRCSSGWSSKNWLLAKEEDNQ